MSLGKSIHSFVQSGEELSPADVLRLQSLEKDFSDQKFAWYLEPVEVDTFIKEESRFDVTIELLRIVLPPVLPLTNTQNSAEVFSTFVFDHSRENNKPISLLEILDPQIQSRFADKNPELIEFHETMRHTYQKVYKQYEPLLELFDEQVVMGLEGNAHALRRAAYVTETLLKFEPSLISLEYVGDFHTYNLNWLLEKMNQTRVLINLEADTVEFLIKRCDLYSGHYVYDDEYQRLSALFLHKIRNEY